MQLVPVGLALGIMLALGGAGALAFGIYALARGGRDENGDGLGGFSERDIHAIAGDVFSPTVGPWFVDLPRETSEV